MTVLVLVLVKGLYKFWTLQPRLQQLSTQFTLEAVAQAKQLLIMVAQLQTVILHNGDSRMSILKVDTLQPATASAIHNAGSVVQVVKSQFTSLM